MASTVQRYRADQSDDRSAVAVSLLENEREHRALRDELQAIRREVESTRREMVGLQDQNKKLVRGNKNLLEILERGGYFRFRMKARADGKDEDVQRKT